MKMPSSPKTPRTALVTGAASGICAEVCRRLARDGVRLIMVDRNGPTLSQMAREIGDMLAAPPLVVDVADPDAAERAIAELPTQLLPDILVNGVGGDTRRISVDELRERDLQEAIATNLQSTFTMTRLLVPAMRQRAWGRIVNFSSIAGRTYTLFSNAAYVSAKAAVIGFTKQCAYELAPFGIVVNAVAHGPIETSRIKSAWENLDAERRSRTLGQIPLRRLGTIAEAAAIVAHLCGDDAGFTTGAVIDVNGGLHI